MALYITNSDKCDLLLRFHVLLKSIFRSTDCWIDLSTLWIAVCKILKAIEAVFDLANFTTIIHDDGTFVSYFISDHSSRKQKR